MLSDAEIVDMQATVSSHLPDTGIITRAGAGTTSTSTGDRTMAAATTVYEGPMHVRVPDAYEIDVLFGDREVSTIRYIGFIPATATPPQHDDQLVLTATTATNLAGVALRVTDVTGGSYNLSTRLILERVT